MKAISIKQPWAWLIVNGHKDIENRTWQTAYRGPVLIHAGKIPDATPYVINGIKVPEPFHYAVGGIVGVAEITDCVSASASAWFSGPFGFVIKNARPLPFRACRGQLGFFEVECGI